MAGILSRDLNAESIKMLGEAIDRLESPLVLYDINYEVIYANQAARELWPLLMSGLKEGLSLEKSVSRMVKGIFPNSSDEFISDATDYTVSSLENGTPIELMGKDGQVFKIFHHKLEGGQTVGTGVDISELKVREKELVEVRRKQDRIIETVEYGLLIVDHNGIICQFNSAYKKFITSMDAEVELGMHIKDLTREICENTNADLGELCFDDWFKAYYNARFGDIEAWEVEHNMPDGRYFLRRQHYDKVLGNIITVSDITEIKKEQLKAQAAERAKSEFLANMSHEIRTPMNGVMGMAELLTGTDLNSRQRTFADTILKSGEALLTIINDILDFSKIDAGQVKLHLEPFNLHEAIEDVATLIAPRTANENLELAVLISQNLPEMYIGDAGRIRQILTNIIGNAVKFTEAGHVLVDVTGEHVGGDDGAIETALIIKVTDTGIGISPQECKTVFEKFNQADNSSTRKHEGTGLGLSITSSLVKLMGGTIGVESEEGVGSTFTVKLRLPVDGDLRCKKVKLPLKSGLRILVIDDNQINREILTEQTTIWGFKTTAVPSGSAALSILDAAEILGERFDLIIVDYHMPGMNGSEVVAKIKSKESLSNIPIIMLTSVDQSDTDNLVRTLGVEAHMTKPVRSSLLFDAVSDILASGEVEDTFKSATHTNSHAHLQNNIQYSDENFQEKPSNDKCVEINKSIDVLIAEDNQVNQIVFEQIVSQANLKFKIAENGCLALEYYKKFQPKLILMDVSMPEMNGFDATSAIRTLEEQTGGHIPIIGVTAHAMRGDREMCLKAGMDDYLSKPISPQKLEKMLLKWLSNIEGKNSPYALS